MKGFLIHGIWDICFGCLRLLKFCYYCKLFHFIVFFLPFGSLQLSLPPLTPASGNRQSVLCIYEPICLLLVFQIPHVKEIIWCLSFFDFFQTKTMPSGSMLSQMGRCHSFLWLNNIPLHTHTHTHTHIYIPLYNIPLHLYYICSSYVI